MPKVWEEAAQTMGAGRMSLLLHVIIPGALPGIFAGLSVAMGVAWICVVSAEMISGQYGIGYYTWQAYGLLDYAGVVVGMLKEFCDAQGLPHPHIFSESGRSLTAHHAMLVVQVTDVEKHNDAVPEIDPAAEIESRVQFLIDYLAATGARGLVLSYADYVGDDRPRITATLQRAFAASDMVFSCGGIGAGR